MLVRAAFALGGLGSGFASNEVRQLQESGMIDFSFDD